MNHRKHNFSQEKQQPAIKQDRINDWHWYQHCAH